MSSDIGERSAADLGLVPRPARVELGAGRFRLDAESRLRGPQALTAMVRRELANTGLPLPDGEGQAAIELELDRALAHEAYRLDISEAGVRLRAGDPAGAFYGVQTLRQLLPPDAFRRLAPPEREWDLPALRIDDAPRFGWRGAMLDVGRHLMPRDFLFRWVDLIAIHKLNVFHLHLTDDQGWRFESHRYPKLQEVASWRRETRGDGTPHGGYYTQDDLRELVRYAALRGITVVPEIDMPGHLRAAIAAYPNLGNHPERNWGVGTSWGVEEHVLDLGDQGLRFTEEILDEVLGVFDSPHIHIGGDECPSSEWAANAGLRAAMRARGVDEVADFQRWLTLRLRDFLASRGRILVGWDEIVDAGPVPGAVVMAWRSEERGRAAAAIGQQVVMAPNRSTYFDYPQGADAAEPGAATLGRIDLDDAYAFDPLAGLDAAESGQVMGTQFQLWSETLATPAAVEYQAFPRGCALAEIAWSGTGGDAAAFRQRLRSAHLPRLDALGVNYRPLDGPHPWQRRGPR